MAHGDVLTTEADIDRALERAKVFDRVPRARTAYYNAEADVVVIRLTNGRRFIVPREELKGLANATVAQLSEIEIYAGLSLAWPQLDVDHYLPYLLEKDTNTPSLCRKSRAKLLRHEGNRSTIDSLYSIILDYSGGTYISQVAAPDQKSAVRVWQAKMTDDDLKTWKLIRAEVDTLSDVPPIPLDGLENAWCASASGMNGLILINIIATQPPTEN